MNEFQRQPRHAYTDPLSRVWLNCAERVGFRVVRTSDAYASSDGRGTLLIATDELFDPDDCLAQMIFHELCHALVEGETGERALDWGLDNSRQGNPWREHACLRLQAWLAQSVGLRDFFAPTTEFRMTFWASLPADPMEPPPGTGRRERSCVAARRGAWRAAQPRWAPHLRAALAATAGIAACVFGGADEPDAGHGLPSLWSTVAKPPPPHPAGHAEVAPYHPGKACAECAWRFSRRSRWYCRQAARVALPDGAPACIRYEPATELDCRTCGACCREAYDAVEVSARDPVNKTHPDLVVVSDTRRKLRRFGGRCAALEGGQTHAADFACAIYPDRPRTCRDFTQGNENCLDARRRVGLSL